MAFDGGHRRAGLATRLRLDAEAFPDSAAGAVLRAPTDHPAGKQGDVLAVEFTLRGIPCLGMNGGPARVRRHDGHGDDRHRSD